MDSKKVIFNLDTPIFTQHDLLPYTKENLMYRKRLQWSRTKYVSKIKQCNKTLTVGTIDAGGSKIIFTVAEVKPDLSIVHKTWAELRSQGGQGYIEKMLEFRSFLIENKIKKVGISFGGPINGTVFEGTDYLIPFGKQIKEFNSDFSKLFKGLDVTVVNDATAMNIGVSVHAELNKEKYGRIHNQIGLIMGGGMGGGAMESENIIEAEPGHIQAGSLNKFGITQQCNMWNDGRVCQQDSCGGSASFVEKVMSKKMNRKITGEDAAQLLQKGDTFALNVYNTAAICYARTFIGMLKACNFDAEHTLFVLHGGGTKTPGLSSRIKQLVEKNLSQEISLMETWQISENICLDAAAYLATGNNIKTVF